MELILEPPLGREQSQQFYSTVLSPWCSPPFLSSEISQLPQPENVTRNTLGHQTKLMKKSHCQNKPIKSGTGAELLKCLHLNTRNQVNIIAPKETNKALITDL